MLEGHVIYCDDLRVENNGKLLLVGVYNTDLVLQAESPAVLEKIQLLIKFRYTLEHCGKEIQIHIYAPTNAEEAEIIHKVNIPPRPTDEFIEKITKAWKDGPIFGNLSVPVSLNQMPVDGTSFIKVELIGDNERLRLNSLRLKFFEEQMEENP